MNEIKQARLTYRLTRQQVNQHLGIPVRTQENWEADRRSPPGWLILILIREYLRIAQMIQAEEEALRE